MAVIDSLSSSNQMDLWPDLVSEQLLLQLAVLVLETQKKIHRIMYINTEITTQKQNIDQTKQNNMNNMYVTAIKTRTTG